MPASSTPYNLNIPNGPNAPRNDWPLMQVNTNSTSSLLAKDHFTFADAASGIHKQVTMINEAAPGFANGGDGVLFANAVAGKSWPFWQNGVAPANVFQLLGASSLSTNGFITLSSGFVIQFGKVVNPSSATGTVNFPSATAFTTNVFGIFMTLARTASGGDSIWINTSGVNDLTRFAWRASTTLSNPTDFFYWVAIGN